MKTRALHRVLAVGLTAAVLWLTGCDRGDVAVSKSKDAQGNTTVHVDGDKVEENLEKTGEVLQQGAQEVKEGAQAVGGALERGAERIEKEVGPVAQEVLSDAAISTKVKAKLLADQEINPFQIDVDTVDGIVTLNGKVASESIRVEAEKIARDTEGVKNVNNVIQVAGQAPTPAPAGTSR
ncbi:MAG TPA: BON domain-containing protein [Thermoanaerobaculia bacterium]|nr:BON domain-containing protein [Thermoanaerobaculia bacterium]